MRFDLKFWVMLLVTLAGVAVPIWLWQSDTTAKSLAVRLTSSVALQIASSNTIPELQVTINGVRVESPFLSTIELSNDGSKPLPTSDFESPIELSIGQGAEIVRANVVSSSPEELSVKLDTKKRSVKISPLLLNPEDRVKIAILTSGDAPTFIPRARIAGVSSIKFEDETLHEKSWHFLAKNAAQAVISLVLYFVFGASFVRSSSVRLTRTLSIFTMLSCAMLASDSVSRIYAAIGAERSTTDDVALGVFITGIAVVVYYLILRKKPSVS